MDAPKISDKVKFWEEQDRINKELIPRVLKTHQLLTDHASAHRDAVAQIGIAEARQIEGLKKTRMQAMAVAAASLVVAIASLVVSFVV